MQSQQGHLFNKCYEWLACTKNGVIQEAVVEMHTELGKATLGSSPSDFAIHLKPFLAGGIYLDSCQSLVRLNLPCTICFLRVSVAE